MDKYNVTVIINGEKSTIEVNKGISLLRAFTENDIYMSAPCGGNGTCGKCKVRFLRGATKITSEDMKMLKKEEIAAGYRLACSSILESDCLIEISDIEEDMFDIVSEYNPIMSKKILNKSSEQNNHYNIKTKETNGNYNIAIDIGTTTIAAAIVGVDGDEVLHVETGVNRQRAYGADVVSRMQASIDGKKEELQQCIKDDLIGLIEKLIEKMGIDYTDINKIAISANTTMGHLLMGYPCDTLGVAPFIPVNISTISINSMELFANKLIGKKTNNEIIILPGISAFVGADIVSGLMSCQFDKTDEIVAFIDLGTNGEMAIGNKDRILVTSTAAGPAFEGGNISCGVGSIAGALCHVNITNGQVKVQTIGDKPLVGLCGTGVIECTYELLKNGVIDETGMMDEKYFEDGFEIGKTSDGRSIVYTQSDVREIQMAKSAVRAGFETLIKRYGVSYEQISKVYLAGGFGYKMNIEKAAGIGLFPTELIEKMIPVGNSSLKGAVLYLSREDSANISKKIVDNAQEISLALDDDFNEKYMEYMFFDN